MDLAYRSFALDLREPLKTAGGTIASREGFLVRVTDGDDHGLGEATPLPGWTESLDACETGLERARAAIEDGAPAALEAADRTVAARHAVSLALADLSARRASTPLYRRLGESSRIGRVPVNVTVDDESPAVAAATARAAVDRGFRSCKLKVGVRSISDDVERVRRVREAVGPGVELRADANGAWTIDEAALAVEAFADLGVSLLEQPLSPEALEGHAALRGRGVPIALDEGLLAHGVDAVVEADAADALVLKPMALGGVDVARQVAAWASEAGIDPIVTTTIDAVVARTAAVHLAAAVPDVPACGLATADLLADDLGRDPVPIERGRAVVPQAKGLGVAGVWGE